MPLEHLVTAMSCLMSTCGTSNYTTFMKNSAIVQPLGDVWGVGCWSKATDLNQKITNLVNDQAATIRILDYLGARMRALQIAVEYDVNERRGKREVADIFDTITYLQFDCNESMSETQNIPVNAELPPFLVSCEADNYGYDWVLIASLDATHRKRLSEKSQMEVINGFGDKMGEYFIGLERLHGITTSTSNGANEVHELLILTQDIVHGSDRFEGKASRHFMQYNSFAIADASNDYTLLSLEGYEGDIVDPLKSLLGQPFSLAQLDLEDTSQVTMFVRRV